MSNPRAFKVILDQETLRKIKSYKFALSKNVMTPGALFKQKLMSKFINSMSIEDFISTLINTKQPTIFAESAVTGDGSDWNQTELNILGDINISMSTNIYDDGHHSKPTIHATPLKGTLLFTPGALLRNDRNGITPDLVEVAMDDLINKQAYYKLYERRLLPLLIEANNTAAFHGTKAFITIPGIGCGQFAGSFKGNLGILFQEVLEKILHQHGQQLSNVQAVYYDPYTEGAYQRKKIQGIDFIVKPLAKSLDAHAQLAHPKAYAEANDDFSQCELFSFVAWDPVSWPGNDFYAGHRLTDDGVKAAATDTMYVMTGIEGYYDVNTHSYTQPYNYKNWQELIVKNNLSLNAFDKIFVYSNSKLKKLTQDNLIESLEVNTTPYINPAFFANSTITLFNAIQEPKTQPTNVSAKLEEKNNWYFLLPDMAKIIYEEVAQKGEINKLFHLSNDPRPDKISKALEILNIKPIAIDFNFYNGYKLYLNTENRIKLETVLNAPLNAIEYSAFLRAAP